ncbi:hypothetical protein [Pseudomonas mangrovi]|uniref:Uncharacterized protein n=1 Tax=Pseudomonas mangrovi TaxID=2161748 RepID=A0A2T5P9K2_9PSED|nr:hypothetical protein [Pseudomonas mangrovi]PTU74385.1 hypothetical protein DBO85_09830 [Pseudomonas mangrovi]
MITPLELALLLAWLVAVPLLSVWSGWFVLGFRWPALRGFFRVWRLLMHAAVSAVLALLSVIKGPDRWGSLLGFQDWPFPWAPFAILAVLVALVPVYFLPYLVRVWRSRMG